MKIVFEKLELIFSELYLEPCQTSKKVIFAIIADGFHSLPMCAKSSILDVWPGSGYDTLVPFWNLNERDLSQMLDQISKVLMVSDHKNPTK